MSIERQLEQDFSPASEQAGGLYEFGPFRVNPAERLLLRDGLPVSVTSKAFDTLLFLVQRHNHLVEKSELMEAVWADSFVEESNLAVTVSMLRKALGDEGAERKYIQTVAKRGYRFIGDVHELTADAIPRASVLESPAPAPLEPDRRRGPTLIIAGIGIVILAGLAALAITARWRASRTGLRTIKSLAVLPFQPLNPGATPDYLGLGLADAVITKLGNTGQIVVRSTSAVKKYAGNDPLVVGRDQAVDAILTGHIESLPNRVRVNVQLVRVADGNLLWADTFEQDPQHLFDLEDEVAQGAAQAMAVQLTGGARMRLARRDTGNSNAHELYLEGRYFWDKTSGESARRSLDYFRRATHEDPKYAQAYAGLADAHTVLGVLGAAPDRDAYEDAKEAALRALSLDDSLAEAHTSLAIISFYYEWNFEQAEREFRRAIALNPNYVVAHDWLSLDLAAAGRSQEAMDEVLRAKELDPLSLIVNTHIGRVSYLARQYDHAIEGYHKVIELDPEFERARMRLGIVYAAEDDFGSALREFETARQLSPADISYLDGLEGYCKGLSGDKPEARKVLAELVDRSRHEYVPAYSMALVSIGLGDRNSAFQWLDRAYEEHSPYIAYIKVEPLLDPIRSDPRFALLLRKVGF